MKLFWVPGYIWLFVQYYFPNGGIVGVAESSRQWREKDKFAPFYSILMYFIAVVGYALYMGWFE